ncbi:MAG: alpha/beta hydrolase fold domain-containing protein [Pseudomonadota bacterium]
MRKRSYYPGAAICAATALFVSCTAVDAPAAEAEPPASTKAEGADTVTEAEDFRSFAAPSTVSANAAAYLNRGGDIERALNVPQSYEEWKEIQSEFDGMMGGMVNVFARTQSIGLTEQNIDGVPVYFATPEQVSSEKAGKIVLSLHGGGYVIGGGAASPIEGLFITYASGFPSVSVDYRMPPDHPFPAAIEDTAKVYEELLKTYEPEDIAFSGASAGGGLAAASILHIRDQGLPLPGAVVLNTPWSDLDKIGDTYFTLEGLDPVLITYDGLLGAMAEIYADGEDMKNPLLSPVYGDFETGFPPSLLITGTRDLFLSNTARLHRALRDAGASSDLLVFEGMWHGFNSVPESEPHQQEVKLFLERHLLSQ